jgi:hypothetical protein
LVVVAIGQVVSDYVFVLDGVLIGAGDARSLAAAMGLLLIIYLPIVLGIRLATPWLRDQGPATSIVSCGSAFLASWWRMPPRCGGTRVRMPGWFLASAPRPQLTLPLRTLGADIVGAPAAPASAAEI